MTRIVQNTVTGKYVNVDPILSESFEYDEMEQATIFNPDVDEMTDEDVLAFVENGYGDVARNLVILPVKITVEYKA